MYTRENYRLVREEIEARRINAESIASARNEELRIKFPDIKEIDDELTGTGLLLFKTACDGKDITPLKERNQELMKKRGELLVKYGYPVDYTRPKYVCPLCSDSGFVGVNTCKCFRELLTMKNIEASGMGRLIDKQSFDNFDLQWYNNEKCNYERMLKNYEYAKSFADEFGSHRRNILMIGNTGTGKTHLSTAIAKVVISKGYDVLYDSAQNIISEFENDRFHSGYGQTEQGSRKYMECDLLIIDDLGTEFINQFTVSCLYNLINTRLNKGLSTIISTNLSSNELSEKYEGRIVSRIVGADYRIMMFSGDDHRIS